jgi:hypothetical protein
MPNPRCVSASLLALLCCALSAASAVAQSLPPVAALDPSRTVTQPRLVSSFHTPLPEQYIWTAGDAAVLSAKTNGEVPPPKGKLAPHYFRASFSLRAVPAQAMLYVAGPREAKVYLNGKLAADLHCDAGNNMVFRTLSADVRAFLRPGRNVVAMEVVRGWGAGHHMNSLLTAQVNSGEVLVAKIVPAGLGIAAAPVLISNGGWKSTLHPAAGWQQSTFDDATWLPVQTLGSIEGSSEFFQWNADAGMYDWPGYLGESPYLANLVLHASQATVVDDPDHAIQDAAAVSTQTPAGFSVDLRHSSKSAPVAPGLLLDFGREVSGRILLETASGSPARVTVQYGESLGELRYAPFLGIDPLYLPPHTEVRGPKSGFRYALLRFLPGNEILGFRKIVAETIDYPVRYEGSFVSSDALLNRIWATGAYTAHLCMQDSFWDGAKRDRARWIGDMEVSGRVVADVFGSFQLTGDALNQLIGPAPVQQHVNGLSGYSAFWIVTEAEYYRQHGDAAQLASMHTRLLQLLALMDREFNADSLYVAASGTRPFVDWVNGYSDDTPEARRAIQMEYLYAYRQAAWLLQQLGDTTAAAHWSARAGELAAAAQRFLLDPATQTFGNRWQTNAMAVISGAATPQQEQAIWKQVLARTQGPHQTQDVISPYYGDYVLQALAITGHRPAALNWMRMYWGGMIAEGATSFWEAYDPSWPKHNPHLYLQADGGMGYYTSLAHGWSSGPTAWLMEQVLGIQPIAAGYSQVRIRPDLAGLQWARGAEPTPHGLLRIGLRQQKRLHITLDLPAGVEAHVSVPVSSVGATVLVNGRPRHGTAAEDGTRSIVTLSQAGHYVIKGQ